MTRLFSAPRARRNSGVTLIELAITIALVGILAALIVQFVAPVRSYIDSSRRAALADTADTALRRIGRDVRLALPNSVRVSGNYIEFMLVRTGGRYRVDSDPAATNTCDNGASSVPANDVLAIGSPDSCFRSIGDIPNIAQVDPTSDYLVVFNLEPGTNNSADVYETPGTGGNKAQIAAGTAGTLVKFAPHTFTFESPANRFFIIEGPVSYGCSGGNLTRYWGYPITQPQGTPPAGPGLTSAILASRVASCTITYEASVNAQNTGLLTIALRLEMLDSQGNTEKVKLYHAVHVSNVP